jgi:hypothetical protein
MRDEIWHFGLHKTWDLTKQLFVLLFVPYKHKNSDTFHFAQFPTNMRKLNDRLIIVNTAVCVANNRNFTWGSSADNFTDLMTGKMSHRQSLFFLYYPHPCSARCCGALSFPGVSGQGLYASVLGAVVFLEAIYTHTCTDVTVKCVTVSWAQPMYM